MRPDARAKTVALMLLGSLLVGGCASMSSKLTFLRPDVTRKDFTRTAPEYDIKPDKRRRQALAVSDRLALAQQRLGAGQYDQAEAQANAALKLDSNSSDAYAMLALVADARGDSTRAGEHYAKAAALTPTRGSALNNYGVWLCGNGRAGESLQWFDRALADPAYATPASARANAGACALDAGQPQRAERDLRMALAQEPENAVALAAMARTAYATGSFMEARAFSERRLVVSPPTAEVLRLASQIERKLGDNRTAERYLQQMTAQPPQGMQSGGTGTR